MPDEAREVLPPFKPERTTTTTRIRSKRNPQRMKKRGFFEGRYVPLRTKLAGFAAGAALTFFGGEKIAGQVFSDTKDTETPGVTVRISQLPSQENRIQDNRIVDLRTQANSYIFKDLIGREKEEADLQVQEMDQVILKNPSFEDMVRVVSDYENYIDQAADKYKIPREIAYGMVLIENGGGHAMMSPAGALGPAQLMRDAAIEMGLRVDPSR